MTGTPSRNDITGVVLAGGRGNRMGGEDKGLITLDGRPMIEHVVSRLAPQVGRLLISANRNLDRYAQLGYRVVPDVLAGHQGPLAGIASALNVTTTPYIVTTPCDSPFVSVDLVSRLTSALASNDAEISVAHDGERIHPVFLMLRRSLLSSLMKFLQDGERKVDAWLGRHLTVEVCFADSPESFVNINDKIDHRKSEDRLQTTT